MPYKILSLDGGGSWSLIQARVLLALNDHRDLSGHALLRQYDMVIANSGGALVLAALASDLHVGQIIDIFNTTADRQKVFSRLSFWEAPLARVMNALHLGPRYSADRKRSGLEHLLRERTGQRDPVALQPLSRIPEIIGKPTLELLICGYNYFTERAVFFRSNLDSRTDNFNASRYDVSLLDAVHAASNAPLNYFNAPAVIRTGLAGTPLKSESWYWDGAVGGFNNPVMAGLVEAMTNGRGCSAHDYRILSLGTGVGRRPVMVGWEKGTAEQQAVYRANRDNDLVVTKKDFGFLRDIGKMARAVLADPPDAASFVAYSVLRPDLENGAPLIRINPCMNPVMDADRRYKLPAGWGEDHKRFVQLLDLDMDAVKDEEVALLNELCDRFLIEEEGAACLPNQYIRGGDYTDRKIGYGSFREAKAHWLAALEEPL